MPSMTEVAYARGWNAYEDGLTIYACPYEKNSIFYHQWMKGYNESKNNWRGWDE